MRKRPISLETKIVVLVWGVVAVSLFMTYYLVNTIIAGNIEHGVEEETAGIAKMTACSSDIIEGLSGRQPQNKLQEVSIQITHATHAQYVVIFDMNGVRKSHPNPDMIGQHIVGDDEHAALTGLEYISKSKGTLGEALRAFCPVYDYDGRQIGAVVVGVLLTSVEQAERQSRMILYSVIALGLMVGAIGAITLARSVRTTLFGLEPFAIARMVEERNAMFQSVREGIIAVDKKCRITLVNNEAIRLLSLSGIQGDPVGRPVNEYVADIDLEKVLESQSAEFDRPQYVNGIHVLLNCLPVKVNGEVVGAIATFRDMTDIKRMAEELTGVRSYVEALRSQAHEFMNKMHVVLGMVSMQCYDQLPQYINRIAREQQVEVNFIGSRIKEPVLAGFILSKISRARELGIEFDFKEESSLPASSNQEVTHNLVTIIGNLLDNAFEALQKSEIKKVSLLLICEDDELMIKITDTGTGIDKEFGEQIFKRGFSTKTGNRGLGLALVKQSLERLAGRIDFSSKVNQGSDFTVRVPYKGKQ